MIEHLAQRDRALAGGEPLEGEAARMEGAEMLGGEIAAHRLAQIGVDVGGGDGADLACIILVAEQVVALLLPQVLHPPHGTGEIGILDLQIVRLAALAHEMQRKAAAADLGVFCEKGGRAVAFIGAGIAGIADADCREIEQPDHGR